MSYEENDIDYEYDYDGEKSGFRKTIGISCILLGILFIVFTSNYFIRDFNLASKGHKVEANIVKWEHSNSNVAQFSIDGKTYTYGMEGYANKFHKKTVNVYYMDDPNEGKFINWGLYVITFISYIFILVIGIFGVNDKSIIRSVKNIFSKRKSTNNHER